LGDGHDLQTWTFRADRPLVRDCLMAALSSLPATVYRVKGILYLEHDPTRRYVLQMIGERTALTADREWAESEPGTQIVFIGQQGTLRTTDLENSLGECVNR